MTTMVLAGVLAVGILIGMFADRMFTAGAEDEAFKAGWRAANLDSRKKRADARAKKLEDEAFEAGWRDARRAER